jgi:DNA-binding winged helix-turn-helix (wHTH) protein
LGSRIEQSAPRAKELPSAKAIVFPPFRLDPANECVWLEHESLVLTRKAFGVLHFLLAHPARLVTKEELLEAVWPETHVGEAVLKVAVAELRKALNDDSREPRYIETLHRRGYRFIGQIAEPGRGVTPSGARALEREADLARLEGWLDRSLEGERQIVFITGEAGIGKTTLVDTFVERASAHPGLWIAQGQCLQQFGEGEPYLPLLEAFTRLCHQPGRERIIDILRKYAPSWLMQMPSLVTEADRDLLRRQVLGSVKERMLREITEAIEVLTAETPLLMVLEDVHWSDYSTIDVISYLARRRGQARLLLVGTYRPADVIVKQHPLGSLKRELLVRGYCSEAALDFLSERAVAQYLALRFSGAQFPPELARLIHQRTDGNPLFMVNVVEYLATQRQIVRRPKDEDQREQWALGVALGEIQIGIPEDLQQMIERQLEMLTDEEQELLLLASVAGPEFSTRTLAGASGGDIAELGNRCHTLVKRRQFLRPAPTIQLNDGSVLERYGFLHVLYQHALYRRVPEARRVLLHRALGEFQETAYADRIREIAAELAVHFAEGRDYSKAIRYRWLSADVAIRRYANREAIEHLGRALKLAEHFSGAERARLEGATLEQRAAAQRAMDENHAAASDYEWVVAYAAQAGQKEWQVKTLIKLSSVLFWTDHQRSLAAAESAVNLSRGLPDQWLYIQAQGYCASRRIRLQGWTDEDFESCLTARREAKEANETEFYSLHIMSCAFFHSYRSEGRLACRAADEGMEVGLETGDAFLYISCQYFKAWALLYLGDWGEALRLAREGIRLSQNNSHATGETVLRLIEARMHLEAQDFASAREAALKTVPLARPGFPLYATQLALAEAQAGLGEYQAAAAGFEEILENSREGPFRLDWIFHLPLYRSLGELALNRGDLANARSAATRLCALAALPGERTFLALGRNLLARIALAENQLEEAAAHSSQALSALGDGDAPLAAWRVHETAAELSLRRGHVSEADSWRSQSGSTLARLASSMDAAEPLRAALLVIRDQQLRPRQKIAEMP